MFDRILASLIVNLRFFGLFIGRVGAWFAAWLIESTGFGPRTTLPVGCAPAVMMPDGLGASWISGRRLAGIFVIIAKNPD